MNQICPRCGNEKPDRFMANEISEIYDGVCFWTCLECGHSWNRFKVTAPRHWKVEEILKKNQ